MEINITQKENKKFEEDMINVNIEFSSNININDFKEYIEKYNKQELLGRVNNELVQINYKDVIIFYSDKKNNYCKTKAGEYIVKDKLYNIETYSNDFVRISKSRIVNIRHINSFNIGEIGKIIVELDDGTREVISRRKVKDVLNYLGERGN